MDANFCVQCGAPRTDGPVCQLCGAGYVEPIAKMVHPVSAGRSASTSAMMQQQQNGNARGNSNAYANHLGYARQQDESSFVRTGQSSTSSVDSHDFSHNQNGTLRRAQSVPVTTANADGPSSQTRGIMKGRYADHPNCDICKINFDVTKRRHQCSCSPLRLLIPWGEQIPGARGYDKSVPQRVCLHCSPELHPIQEELVALYARSNAENNHDTKGRLHLPYTNSLEKECRNAADIIGNFFRDGNASSSDRSIPVAFLEKAQGLAIMTIVKVGFVVVGKIGTGLVISKLDDGTWSAPSAIGTVGLGGGFQIGGELVEVIIILGSQNAVEVFHKPQVNLGAGLDIAVGPYGRSAEAAAALSTTRLNANYSYSHSKGLYAGISLQGSVIATRNDLNRKFYGRDLEPKDLLNGSIGQPVAAKPLYDAIYHAMNHVEEHKDILAERAAIMGACRICQCPTFAAHTIQMWNKKCKNCDHIH